MVGVFSLCEDYFPQQVHLLFVWQLWYYTQPLPINIKVFFLPAPSKKFLKLAKIVSFLFGI